MFKVRIPSKEITRQNSSILFSSKVICEKLDTSDLPELTKKKLLVPGDISVSQFNFVIRKRVAISKEKAIFVFIDDVLPPSHALMSDIYDKYKDSDGFLYVVYSGENTFG